MNVFGFKLVNVEIESNGMKVWAHQSHKETII